MTLAAAILDRRTLLGLDVPTAARQAGISVRAWVRYEAGGIPRRFGERGALARWLDVPDAAMEAMCRT